MIELLSESRYNEQMDSTVIPYLEKKRKDDYHTCRDGAKIHYALFSADSPRGSVTMVHGYTESIEKYKEIIYYFLISGLSVCIYEHRGHGLSHRYLDDLTLTHIPSFSVYVDDLDEITEQVAKKLPSPHYLYAHSMGGAVAALYLESGKGIYQKAVLTSPMIAPDRGGYPLWVSLALCRTFFILGKSKQRIFLSSPYPGHEEFESSCSTSAPRFSYYESFKRQTKEYQNYSPTYRWTYESLRVTDKILKKEKPESISIPVKICVADDDHTVLRPAQIELSRRIPGAVLETYRAKHEIFGSQNNTLQSYLNSILEFYQ